MESIKQLDQYLINNITTLNDLYVEIDNILNKKTTK